LAYPSQTVRHYAALDGLRGTAALAIVCYHIGTYFHLPFTPGRAYLAVDFFFMLSGFVISYAYDARLKQGRGGFAFLRQRLIRLYPMVVLGVLLGTAAFLAWSIEKHVGSAGAILRAAAANAVLLPSSALLTVSQWAFPVDTPLWSLAFELWINVIYAFGFVMFGRRGLLVACAGGALLLLWAALTHAGLNIGFRWSDFYLGGARVIFPFMLGVLLCRHFTGFGRHAIGHFVFLLLIALLAAPAGWGAWFDVAAVFVGFPVIVTVGALAPPHQALDPIWRWLGAISYPLYAIHYPFVLVISNLFKLRHLDRFNVYAALGTLILTVVAASAATFWYDEPVRRWLKRRMRTIRPSWV
jgi:peptidoglycan/LPS O-acetylase OafA/YrhL